LNCRALSAHRHTIALLVVLATSQLQAAPREPEIVPADLTAVKAAIEEPGARAVLVNVWASFCDACKAEMPAILKVYRERKARGMRLVLVSADDEDSRKDAQKFLASLGVDFPSYLKTGDDMAFINGLEPRWTGALPVSILYDGQGHQKEFFPGEVSPPDLAAKVDNLLITKKGRSR
jgi:thiol-disulfide isomerase/thioredoxin